MKFRVLLTAFVLVACSGCIKVDETLTIEKSGSGNLELLYTISEQTVSQMKAMFKLRDQMDAVTGQAYTPAIEDTFQRLFLDPSEDQIKKFLKKYEQFGITIETLKIESRNASRNVTLKLAFTDLARAARADFFPRHGFNLSQTANGTYTFLRTPERDDGGYQIQNLGTDTAGLLAPVMNGFRVALKVNTPGKIIETNASRKTLYNAAWIFDFDKDSNAIKTLQNQTMKIVFDGRGIQLPELRQFAKSVQGQKR